MKSLFLILALPACTGGQRANTGVCPEGETCSAKTPNGLHFIGNVLTDDVVLAGPSITAIGGTQDVALQYNRGDGLLIALDLPYDTDDDGGAGVTVDHTNGSVVTVRGVGANTNYLRILDATDGTLFDRKALTAAPLTRIALVPTDDERVPTGAELAWVPGTTTIGVALLGPAQERLVDTSLQLALAGSTRLAWDSVQLPNATSGTYSLAITAANQPATSSDVVIIDHADSVAPIDPPTIVAANAATLVCFGALASSRYLIGLQWTFQVDGNPVTPPGGANASNCASILTAKTTGNVLVQAAAGGQQATLTLPVGGSARTAPHHTIPLRTTAGERAAM